MRSLMGKALGQMQPLSTPACSSQHHTVSSTRLCAPTCVSAAPGQASLCHLQNGCAAHPAASSLGLRKSLAHSLCQKGQAGSMHDALSSRAGPPHGLPKMHPAGASYGPQDAAHPTHTVATPPARRSWVGPVV